MELQTLTDHFAIPDVLAFSQTEHGLIRANITTPACTAELYLQGAHITHWQPTGHRPVLFLSERSFYTPGKAIRGGIPIVFPWFGPRTAAPDDLHLTLTLGPSDTSRALGYDHFALVYDITIGVELQARLTVRNQGTNPLYFEEALHTYFSIGDSQQISIIGLSDTEYIDKTDSSKKKRQTDPLLTLTGETDRPYLNTVVPVNIDDPVYKRRVTIDKAESKTTVVWNPWSELIKTLPDLTPDCWVTMVCIETANVGPNAITLAPGEQHTMEAHLFVQEFAAGYTGAR